MNTLVHRAVLGVVLSFVFGHNSLVFFKWMWFVVSFVGFVLSIFVFGEVTADAFFVFRRKDMSMHKARVILARQNIGSAAVIACAQLVFTIIRFGAIVGPTPASDKFSVFWEYDGTLVMILSIAMSVVQVWQVWHRGVINRAVQDALDERTSVGNTGDTA